MNFGLSRKRNLTDLKYEMFKIVQFGQRTTDFGPYCILNQLRLAAGARQSCLWPWLIKIILQLGLCFRSSHEWKWGCTIFRYVVRGVEKGIFEKIARSYFLAKSKSKKNERKCWFTTIQYVVPGAEKRILRWSSDDAFFSGQKISGQKIFWPKLRRWATIQITMLNVCSAYSRT